MNIITLPQALSYMQVTNIDEVKYFLKACVNLIGLAFNPDTEFSHYEQTYSFTATFTLPECERLEKLIDNCFTICKRQNALNPLAKTDPYLIVLKEITPMVKELESQSERFHRGIISMNAAATYKLKWQAARGHRKHKKGN